MSLGTFVPLLQEYSPSCLTGHMARVFSMATNPIHQEFVATGSEDETIRLWRVKSDCSAVTACHAISPKSDPWMKVSWSDDGTLLAGGCSDGTACVSRLLPDGVCALLSRMNFFHDS